MAPPGSTDSMMATLLDPALDAAYNREGFVVLDALGDDELAVARDAWTANNQHPGHGIEFDVVRRATEGTDRIESLVGPIWDALLERTLTDHRRFLLSFITKWPGPESVLKIHQDWTYVDEQRYRSMSYWIALDDCSVALDNGPVAVLPGSHRMLDAYRGPAVDDWYRDVSDQLEALLVPVDLRAGQAILLDNALLHGSAPNRSTSPRRGLAAAVAPAPARFRFAVSAPDDRVSLHDLGSTYPKAFDPNDVEVRGRPAIATPRRLVAAQTDVLLRSAGPELPEDLEALCQRPVAPDPTGALAAIATTARGEVSRARSDDWSMVPAPFLSWLAPTARPTDGLLPLTIEGQATAAGRDPFRATASALLAHDPTATSWLLQLDPARSWTQIAHAPGATVAAAQVSDGCATGAVEALGTPLAQGWSGSHPTISLTNSGSDPVWVLMTSSVDGRRSRARRRLAEVDETIAAVAPASGSTRRAAP